MDVNDCACTQVRPGGALTSLFDEIEWWILGERAYGGLEVVADGADEQLLLMVPLCQPLESRLVQTQAQRRYWYKMLDRAYPPVVAESVPPWVVEFRSALVNDPPRATKVPGVTLVELIQGVLRKPCNNGVGGRGRLTSVEVFSRVVGGAEIADEPMAARISADDIDVVTPRDAIGLLEFVDSLYFSVP